MAKASNHSHALPGADDVMRTELANGMIVLVRENFTSPSVVVDGLLPGGSLLESREKAGLANFHAEMLQRGTQRHSFEEFFEEIESLGASLGLGANNHTYSFDSKSLAEDLPVMLNLLAEVLRQPSFPADHIEKVRGEIITGLHMRQHNTRQMASLAFYEMTYPDHPYSKSPAGYLDTIPEITRDDIVAFHQHFGPRGAIVVIVGAVKTSDAVQMVEEAFGDWENPAQVTRPEVPPAPAITKTQQKFVPIAGKTQSDIIMGWPGPKRVEPDFQAARIANSIMGVFGLMGRLGDAVREKQGLAYYSSSRLSGGLGPGPWEIFAGVSPANVELAVETIREEVRRMVEEPVAAEELADNKALFKGQIVLSLETNDGVAGVISTMELYQLGLDYLRNYATMIDAISIEDVQAAAAKYLNPSAYALAVAGPEANKGS